MESFGAGTRGTAQLDCSMASLYPRASDYEEWHQLTTGSEDMGCVTKDLLSFMLTKSDLMRLSDSIRGSMVEKLERNAGIRSPVHKDLWPTGMLDTYITHTADGTEKGTLYAADIGGTNVRACQITLNGEGQLNWTEARRSLARFPVEDLVPMEWAGFFKPSEPSPPDELKRSVSPRSTCDGTSPAVSPKTTNSSDWPRARAGPGTANQISLIGPEVPASRYFGAIGCLIHRLQYPGGVYDMPTGIPSPPESKLGFTFSYPCKQSSLKSSVLMHWVKGIEAGRLTDEPLEGRDVGDLFQKQLTRLGCNTDVAAVVNDTAATLMAASYKYGRLTHFRMAVVLGTGVNVAYVEPEASSFGYVGSVINMEIGGYPHVPMATTLDRLLDAQSANPGGQLYEKIVSGRYLGELLRLLTLQTLQETTTLPATVHKIDSITAREAALLLPGQKFCLGLARQEFFDVWDIVLTDAQLYTMQTIALLLFERSIQLAAAAICAVFRRTIAGHQYMHVSAAVDGSLYSHNHWYSTRLNRYVQDMLGGMDTRWCTLQLKVMPDASLAGAAVVAALAPHEAVQ